MEFAKRNGIAPPEVALTGGKFFVVPENERPLPQLDLALPLKHLAMALGLLAGSSDFFKQGESFVTVDSKTGEVRPVTSARFCSLVESWVWPFRVAETKKGSGIWLPRYARIGKDSAQLLLESDDFRAGVRELRGVHEVRLPVWRGDGADRTLELLPEGYDEASGVFTADTVPFDFSLDQAEARKQFDDMLAGYPWLGDSRSVQVAAMLSPFVRLLLPRGSKRLMIIHIGNQPGTGKSTLARMALAGVYGAAAVKAVDRDPAELRKVLDTAAFERKPFIFLDNMTDLRSPELNAFVTSGRWSARVLGKSQTEEVTIEAQVFVNGNQLDVGRELARRAAVCSLFLPTDPLDREFSHEITDEWLLRPDTRSRLLAMAWAAVRHWRDQGMPIDPRSKRPSFEAYTELVGSIVATFGMGAPFAPTAIAGDAEGEATKELLDAAAEQVFMSGKTALVFTNPQLIDLADEAALLDVIVPYAKDQHKALGKKFAVWRGRILTHQARGFRYEFGKRDGPRGALYPLTILPSAAAP